MKNKNIKKMHGFGIKIQTYLHFKRVNNDNFLVNKTHVIVIKYNTK